MPPTMDPSDLIFLMWVHFPEDIILKSINSSVLTAVREFRHVLCASLVRSPPDLLFLDWFPVSSWPRNTFPTQQEIRNIYTFWFGCTWVYDQMLPASKKPPHAPYRHPLLATTPTPAPAMEGTQDWNWRRPCVTPTPMAAGAASRPGTWGERITERVWL